MEANRVATDQRNNLSSRLRLRIGSSRHAWMDSMVTWSSIDTRTLKPWIYSNRHFNSSWQVYTIHESSDRQLHHARTTSTTLNTKHQGSLRKGTQQTNRNHHACHDKTFLRINTFYTHAYITKTLTSGPASAETRDRRRINTMKMSCRRWVSRINGAAAGDMHHPMSQCTISPSRAVTVISPMSTDHL